MIRGTSFIEQQKLRKVGKDIMLTLPYEFCRLVVPRQMIKNMFSRIKCLRNGELEGSAFTQG